MNARWIRNLSVIVLLPLPLVASVGCKEKRPPQPLAIAAPAAPPELAVTLQASVSRPASIAFLTHTATMPRRPGDGVQVSTRAVVPEGHRLEVGVEGTAWSIPVSSRATPDLYAGSSEIPSIGPGTYKLHGAIRAPGGQVVAEIEAADPIVVLPKTTACEDAQANLVALRVLFSYNRSDLDAKAKEVLTAAAAILRPLRPSGVELTVTGRCDERGTVEYNLALGDRRALMARDYLVDLGVVDPAHAKKVSLGKEQPDPSGSDEESWAQNRRADITLTCEGN